MRRADTLHRYESRVNRLIDHIVNNLSGPLTLEEMAAVSSFSPFHLHRIFSTVMGETLAAFICRVRIERAAVLLLWNPTRSVTDIAFACGFSSSQNLARAFTRHMGMPPGVYRRCRREEGCGLTPAGAGNDDNGKNGNAGGMGLWHGGDAAGASGHHLHLAHSLLERSATMDVRIEEMPRFHVAYLRHVGPYTEATIGPVWGRLMEWAGARGLLRPGVKTLGVSWDDPEVTPPEHCRYDACIVIAPGVEVDGGCATQEVGGGLYAVYRRPVACGQFTEAWNELFGQWLPTSGMQPDDRPCFELYNDVMQAPPEGPWDVSICMPVRPL